MVEIIKRHEGFKSAKEQILGIDAQISYNDWGHLTIRVIQSNEQDVLIVLDKNVSRRMINFLKHNNDLPF